jgi:hypothetical protein
VAITLLVLMLIFLVIAGPMKVFKHPHMVREFERFGYPYWLARLAGVWNRDIGFTFSVLIPTFYYYNEFTALLMSQT